MRYTGDTGDYSIQCMPRRQFSEEEKRVQASQRSLRALAYNTARALLLGSSRSEEDKEGDQTEAFEDTAVGQKEALDTPPELDMAAPSWKDFAPEPYDGRMGGPHPIRMKNYKKGMETAIILAYPQANEAARLTILRKLLNINSREPATTYINEEIAENKTWEEATAMLSARFEGEKEKLKSLELLLDGLRQSETEDVDAYYTRWRCTYELTGLNLSEEFKVVIFKRTLRDVVRLDIAGERPNSVDSLLMLIRNRDMDGRYKGASDGDSQGGEEKAPEPKSKFSGECFWCGKIGHREADCNSKKRGDPKKIRRIVGKLNRKTRRIQNIDILGQVFLDMGSDVSLIGYSKAIEFQCYWELEEFNVNWGRNLLEGDWIVKLPFYFNGCKNVLTLYPVSDGLLSDLLGCQVLLGDDFMTAYRYDVGYGRITSGDDDQNDPVLVQENVQVDRLSRDVERLLLADRTGAISGGELIGDASRSVTRDGEGGGDGDGGVMFVTE